ncbi:MAG: hypothetical protein WHS87_01645 [Anaerolineales bacterium]
MSSSNPQRAFSLFTIALIATGIIFVVYGVAYFAPSNSTVWKDYVTNLLIVLAAIWSAIIATLLWKAYQADPPLRRVWFNFSLALWLWSLAEILWTYQVLSLQEINIGIADAFWVLAYFLFEIALYAQYKLILTPPKWQGRVVFATLTSLTIGLTLLFAWFLSRQQGEALTLPALINAFYPIGDLAIGVGALYIGYLFRGGLLNRPWLAMFLFALSDGLYAWLFNIGQYSALVEQSTLAQYITDSLYLVAYLAVGLGCFMQWLTLRYGFFLHAPKS